MRTHDETTTGLSRRSILGLLGAGVTAVLASDRLAAAQRPEVTVYKDPSCGCCGGWVAHVKRAGFPVDVKDMPDLARIKSDLKVPADLQACHTARVGGYTVEGHVPAAALDRLLAERPDAWGLAVPGMPAGSPGMEGGAPERYDVVLVNRDGSRRTFKRFVGADVQPLR
jgi:hypothetical protein